MDTIQQTLHAFVTEFNDDLPAVDDLLNDLFVSMADFDADELLGLLDAIDMSRPTEAAQRKRTARVRTVRLVLMALCKCVWSCTRARS